MDEAKPVEFIKRIHPMGRGKAIHLSRDIAMVCGIISSEYVKIRPIGGGCMILPCSKEEVDTVLGKEGDGK